MKAPRDSLLRRIAGMSAGILLGCGGAAATLILVADASMRSGGGSADAALGIGLIEYGYGPALLVGGLLGGLLGRWHLARPQRRPWTRRPRGTLLNHYPVAMVGGVIVGAASSFFTIPAATRVVDTLTLYADVVMPRIVHTTKLLMIAAIVLGVLSVARWTMHALDRDIHLRRRLRIAMRARRVA